MDIGDPTFASIVIKFLCVLASIAIGVIMISQSYANALVRRRVLISTMGRGLTRDGLEHLCALLINIVFLWILSISVVILPTLIFGYPLSELTGSSLFKYCALFFVAPLSMLVISGKSFSHWLK